MKSLCIIARFFGHLNQQRVLRYVSMAMGGLFAALMSVHMAYAQSNPVGAKIEAAATSLQELTQPIGILSFTIIGIAFAFAPAAQQWASEHKRGVGGVIVGLVMLTFIGDIVSWIVSV